MNRYKLLISNWQTDKLTNWLDRINLPGLGDEWGAAPPPNNPLESAIKELGSHLLQVSEFEDVSDHTRNTFGINK